MSLTQMLQQSGVIDSMARELNIDPQTARMATGALLPAIVVGMGRSATAAPAAAAAPGPLGGLGGLAGAILGGGGGGLLDMVLGQHPTPVQQGNDILGNIFGTKDVSRSVAGEVSAITGLDEGLLKKMLPILAMAVMGYLAKSGTQSGGAAPQSGPSLGGILGSIVSGLARG